MHVLPQREASNHKLQLHNACPDRSGFLEIQVIFTPLACGPPHVAAVTRQ